jgi:ATP-binding cassette, subfamily C (CFTR/MRP), member 1
LQLSDLIRGSLETESFDLNLFSKTISSMAALIFCVLSFVEHRRSTTPSGVLVLYMLACLLGHCAEILILPTQHGREALYFLFARTFLELAVLVSECQSKKDVLLPDYEILSPEERAGILERAFFWWINPILLQGYRSFLTDTDLPSTGRELSSKGLRQKILLSWDQRRMGIPQSIYSLVTMTDFKGR